MEASRDNDESVGGDECHIVSVFPKGPRYDPKFASNPIDHYSNLILLCKVHHKLIDDQDSTYTAQLLRKLKANHEKWVAEKLDYKEDQERQIRIRRVAGNIPDFLRKITSGKELLAIVSNACAFSFDHDDLKTEAEVELVSSFLQDAQDRGDIGLDEAGEEVRVGFQMTKSIKELEQAGFWVFGGREFQVIEGGKAAPSDWPVAILLIVRSSSEEILKVPTGEKGV